MSAFKPFSLRLGERMLLFERPQIMGIVNVTPDSFFSGSRTSDALSISRRVEKLIAEGADMIDIGAYSSRPGADEVSPEEETLRLQRGMKALREVSPDIPVSVDTFRASVARRAIEDFHADIINDIAGGLLDPDMHDTVASLSVPYILMHMRGTPSTMQSLTDYPSGVVAGVIEELSHQVNSLQQRGVADIIIDPGFGFAKTLQQNYQLMAGLDALRQAFDRPMLIGISRKSMITKALGIATDEALNGTTVLNTISLLSGAAILRVHDVAAARQALTLTSLLNQ